MINSKLTICFWILFFIILSSNTHAAQEEMYSGEIINGDHPLSPFQLCAEALNDPYAAWVSDDAVDKCSSNIKCLSIGKHEEPTTLTQIPENGVICDFRTGEPPNMRVCYNKKCIFATN